MSAQKIVASSRQSVVAIALILFGFALAGTVVALHLKSVRTEAKLPPGAETSSRAPSTVRPDDQQVGLHAVAPNNPKYISIPSISTGNLRIFGLGLLADSTIAAPGNIYDTGWYKGSAQPGQGGAMFLYGHVSSWQARGAFYDLHKMVPGQDIIVTRGDNARFTYRVVATKTYAYDAVNMKKVLAPIDAIKPGLNLMTCAGRIIKGTNDFDKRYVVFASLVTD